MTLNPTRSKVPHICVTSIPESQISVRFALRPAIFELQAILRQVDRMTPKRPRLLECERCPIYVTNNPGSQISPHFIFLYDQPFSRYKLSIIGNAPNDHRIGLNT